MKKVPLLCISGTLLRGERAGFGLTTAKSAPNTRCCGGGCLQRLQCLQQAAGKAQQVSILMTWSWSLGPASASGRLATAAVAGGGGGGRGAGGVGGGGRPRAGLGAWVRGPGEACNQNRGTATRPPGYNMTVPEVSQKPFYDNAQPVAFMNIQMPNTLPL
jgi:hypothetical protein